MITDKIPVIDSVEDVSEMSMRIYRNELPGFQIESGFVRHIGLIAIIDIVESVNAASVADSPPVFDDIIFRQSTSAFPHIDGGWKGLAIHYNRTGYASLALAHLVRDDEFAAEDFNIFPHELDAEQDVFSYLLNGEVQPGTVTIFSEGNIMGLKPTAHQFTNSRRTDRSWARIASDRHVVFHKSDEIKETLGYLFPDLPTSTSASTSASTGKASTSAEAARS